MSSGACFKLAMCAAVAATVLRTSLASDFHLHAVPASQAANLDRNKVFGLQAPLHASHSTTGSAAYQSATPQSTKPLLRPHAVIDQIKPSRCGRSIDDALAANCSYDALSMQWLPGTCSFTQAAEFRSFAADVYSDPDWLYFNDQAGTDPIVDISTKLDHGGYWTTMREHLVHCVLMHRRLVEGMQTAEGLASLDSMTRDAAHSKHCLGMVLDYVRMGDPAKLGDVQSWGRVIFGDCDA